MKIKIKTIGKAIGTLASLTGIFVLCMLFGFNHQQYVTMLPKSITTAIGIGISEELGGIVTITVAVIIIKVWHLEQHLMRSEQQEQLRWDQSKVQ